jgi:hypothetical protein
MGNLEEHKEHEDGVTLHKDNAAEIVLRVIRRVASEFVFLLRALRVLRG